MSTIPPTQPDPRDRVTQHAFRVAPTLLDQPLASPWRRGWALLLDGIAVSILANAPGLIFGLAVAFVALRASIRPAEGGVIRRSARFMTRAVTAVIVFAVAVSTWETITDLGANDQEDSAVMLGSVGGARLTGLEGVIAGAEMIAIARAEDEAEAREGLEDLISRLRSGGVTDAQIREVLDEVPRNVGERPWLAAALDSVSVALDARLAAEARRDSLAARSADEALASYGAALAAGDSATAADLRANLPVILSRDTLETLQAELEEERAQTLSLAQELADERERGGVIDAFRTFAEDLGLGFGWTGLYFTAFTVLWRGQTPGKRFLKIRVVRLDAVPLGWWASFGRFAGYAAGLATGLLGFAQIFWDPNRQAIQDKIAATVVVRA